MSPRRRDRFDDDDLLDDADAPTQMAGRSLPRRRPPPGWSEVGKVPRARRSSRPPPVPVDSDMAFLPFDSMEELPVFPGRYPGAGRDHDFDRLCRLPGGEDRRAGDQSGQSDSGLQKMSHALLPYAIVIIVRIGTAHYPIVLGNSYEFKPNRIPAAYDFRLRVELSRDKKRAGSRACALLRHAYRRTLIRIYESPRLIAADANGPSSSGRAC